MASTVTFTGRENGRGIAYVELPGDDETGDRRFYPNQPVKNVSEDALKRLQALPGLKFRVAESKSKS